MSQLNSIACLSIRRIFEIRRTLDGRTARRSGLIRMNTYGTILPRCQATFRTNHHCSLARCSCVSIFSPDRPRP